jgi:hypothetical protein
MTTYRDGTEYEISIWLLPAVVEITLHEAAYGSSRTCAEMTRRGSSGA